MRNGLFHKFAPRLEEPSSRKSLPHLGRALTDVQELRQAGMHDMKVVNVFSFGLGYSMHLRNIGQPTII